MRNQKKSRSKKWIFWLIIIGVIILLIKQIHREKLPIIQGEQITNGQMEECLKNDFCQKKVENLAAQTLLQQQMDAVKAEYDTKIKALETQLEEKRKEELSFQ